MVHVPAAILGLALAATAASATTTNENGYEVTRSQTEVPVPAGKVGRKTIDREARTGNTDDTDGNSSNFTLTVGGFMNRCPMPDDELSDKFVAVGDFEVSIVSDTVDTDIVPTERRHYEKRMTARIKVFVNDDLSVSEGEIDGEFSSNMDGVRTGPVRVHKRFPIRAYGVPDRDALVDITTATGDIAAAALMWNSSVTILDAQRAWRVPNTCTELLFDPPSESRAVTSGETVEVRVKYRLRDTQQPLPRGKWEVAIPQGGRVAEAEGQVRNDGMFIVRYIARSSGAPQEGDGMLVHAWSAGGRAQEHWKIRTGLKLAIEHRIGSRRDTPSAKIGMALFEGTVRFDLPLEPFSTIPGRFDGETSVTREMVVGHVTPKCAGRATQVELWRITAEVDSTAGQLRLHVNPINEHGEGSWVCHPGGQDELSVHVGSEFDYQDVLTMPSRSGSRQQFSRRGVEFEETLTVTIP